ncbi:MAG: arginase family protein [Acidobacteriia bacterium]|nr:arginase family protein [Terriglobia bacterium]
MAVKIIRQPKKIALVGSATSAAALRAGHERASAALRAAGLVDRLKSRGFDVADLGDTATYVFQPDDEFPRARNVSAVLKSLNDLRPRVEVAVKSGALPLVLTGDCISVMAVIAAARRYHRNVSLIYMDRDADLNVPATTPSGCVDGMVISQVIGRGAPELVRFWGEPPLVREHDVALFGFERLDLPEEQFLANSLLRRHPALEVSTVGAVAAAHAAVERVHAAQHEFVLHFDVDVINSEEFPWTNFPGSGGLSLNEVRDALRVFTAQPNLVAIEVAAYNPDLDPDGQGARKLIDLLADVLSIRLEAAPSPSVSSEQVVSDGPVAVAESPAAPSADPQEPPAPDSVNS